MAKTPLKQDRPDRDRPLPRLPHPSWRWATAGRGAETPLTADDFWSKLGI